MRSFYNLKPNTPLGKQYRVIDFLGGGFEGEVYKIEEKYTRIVRAAKIFYKKRQHKHNPHVTYARKLYKLKSCPIVMHYHHQDRTDINGQTFDFLVSDFIDGELLSNHIDQQNQKRMQPFEALHLFYAIVKGVEEIHNLKEYHGDLHTDNIIIKRKGIGYEVNLIDLYHLGRPTRLQMQEDVFDLIQVLYEMIGGQKYYLKMPNAIKQIIMGRKHSLICKKFQTAGDIRRFLEEVSWD